MQNLMPPVNTPDKLFHDGDPTTGVEGTIVTAEFLNNDQSAIRDTQQELINVLAAATISPDESKQNQLVTAIKLLIDNAVSNAKYVPDVGELYITKSQTDPNTRWPGTTWVYVGAGLTLRTAKADFSDLGTTVGSDSVTLSVDNMPGHAHSFNATTGSYSFPSTSTSSQAAQNITSGAYDFAAASTSSYDYGTKTSNSAGAHIHATSLLNDGSYALTYGSSSFSGTGLRPANWDTQMKLASNTNSAGAHTHTVGIGAHSHTIDLPSHTHSVSVPSHSHTVSLPSHTHTVSGTSGATGSGSSFSVLQRSVMVAVWERTA